MFEVCKNFNLRTHTTHTHTHTHTFMMVVLYRLYSGMCGELIFNTDDFEGINVELWCSDSTIECFGMWAQQGVWIIRVSFIVLVILVLLILLPENFECIQSVLE